MQIRDAGAVRTIFRFTLRQAGVNRAIRRMKMMIDDELRTVATFVEPLSVSIQPSFTRGYGPGTQPSSVATDLVTAVVSGGQAPFSYSWTRVSGAGSALVPNQAATRFTAVVPANSSSEGVFRCTVVDAMDQEASGTVSAQFINLAGGGGPIT